MTGNAAHSKYFKGSFLENRDLFFSELNERSRP